MSIGFYEGKMALASKVAKKRYIHTTATGAVEAAFNAPIDDSSEDWVDSVSSGDKCYMATRNAVILIDGNSQHDVTPLDADIASRIKCLAFYTDNSNKHYLAIGCVGAGTGSTGAPTVPVVYIYSLTNFYNLTLINSITPQDLPHGQIGLDHQGVFALEFNSSGSMLAVGTSNGFELLDHDSATNTFVIRGDITVGSYPITGFVFNPDNADQIYALKSKTSNSSDILTYNYVTDTYTGRPSGPPSQSMGSGDTNPYMYKEHHHNDLRLTSDNNYFVARHRKDSLCIIKRSDWHLEKKFDTNGNFDAIAWMPGTNDLYITESNYANGCHVITEDPTLNKWIKTTGLPFPYGELYQFNNIGFVLLEVTVDKSGMPNDANMLGIAVYKHQTIGVGKVVYQNSNWISKIPIPSAYIGKRVMVIIRQKNYPVWTASMYYEQDTIIIPTNAKANKSCYKCTTAGTADTLEPDWSTAQNVGSTITDGGVVWTKFTDLVKPVANFPEIPTN